MTDSDIYAAANYMKAFGIVEIDRIADMLLALKARAEAAETEVRTLRNVSVDLLNRAEDAEKERNNLKYDVSRYVAISTEYLAERDAFKARAEAAESELAVVIAERDRAIKATEEVGKQLEGYRTRTWGSEAKP